MQSQQGQTAPAAKAAKPQAQASKAAQKATKKPGQSNGQGNGQNSGQNKPQSQSNGRGNGSAPAGVRGSAGDPPGNNGTVKIAALGDLDRIPNNTPHPGCSFEVQWYGFDAGSDVVSTVSFTPQAPTGDVTITVNGPTSVPVGQDAASGAGTATGLDAVQAYTLSFSGGEPAKQGYHVRLTVATPRSLGNDTKTKVFWVEPCEAAPAAPAAPTEPADAAATPASIVGPPPRPQAPATPGATAGATPAAAAIAASPDRVSSDEASNQAGAGVPTNIDAGEHRNALTRAVSSPWGIGLIGLGAVLVALGAVVARRRA